MSDHLLPDVCESRSRAAHGKLHSIKLFLSLKFLSLKLGVSLKFLLGNGGVILGLHGPALRLLLELRLLNLEVQSCFLAGRLRLNLFRLHPGGRERIHLSFVFLVLYDLLLCSSGVFLRPEETLRRLQARGFAELMARVNDVREPHRRRGSQLRDEGLLNLKDLLEGGQLLGLAAGPEAHRYGDVHIRVPFPGVKGHEASLQLHLDFAILIPVQEVQDVAAERPKKGLSVDSGDELEPLIDGLLLDTGASGGILKGVGFERLRTCRDTGPALHHALHGSEPPPKLPERSC